MRKFWKRCCPVSLILIFALILGSFIGSATAKYIYSTKLTAKVTFTAELAEKIELLEHQAETDYGSKSNYKLTDETVAINAYELMPGVDIPKDPYIKITKKSPVPAYLYVEVVAETNSAIEFEIDQDYWKKLYLTGPKGGDIWVYYIKDKDEEVLTDTNCPSKVFILEDNQITVSHGFLAADSETVDMLTFWAYLYEAYKSGDDYASPETVFTDNHPANP